MEELSEAKIHKSKPEVIRNYFYSSTEIFESVASHTVFVYDKPRIHVNWQTSADICAPSLKY